MTLANDAQGQEALADPAEALGHVAGDDEPVLRIVTELGQGVPVRRAAQVQIADSKQSHAHPSVAGATPPWLSGGHGGDVIPSTVPREPCRPLSGLCAAARDRAGGLVVGAGARLLGLLVREPLRGCAGRAQGPALRPRDRQAAAARRIAADPAGREAIDGDGPALDAVRDPPDHGRLRRLAAPVFAPRTVAAQRGPIERLARRQLERLPRGTAVDIVGDFAYPLSIDVVSELLGVPEGDRPLIRDWVRTITASLDVIRTPASIKAGAERAVELGAYFQDLVAMHRRSPRGDLLDLLIEARDAGERLSEDELLAACILFLFAGHEASAQLVANGLLALAEDEAAYARLRAGAVALPTAVAELLRFTSPQQIAFRYALEETRLGGTTIRQGQTVGFGLGAANRDPTVFPDPDRLDLGREAARQLAFGAGIHSCIGAPLARLEAELSFALLARHLAKLQVIQVERQDGVIVRGLARLVLAL